ncbi:MAG TPA: hypothetical protein EYP04_04760 [Anaerolineae bacterium]|nr:hypothetical protein [Anaerolineae bacterium]HIQ04119.1 hypothetical protein [Anaerolineae bacterium]
MAEHEFQVGMKVRVRPSRPFAGREGEVQTITPTRITVRLLPNGPELDFLPHDIEVAEEKTPA